MAALVQQQQQLELAAANDAQDPVSYDKLRESFVRDLRHFHDTRGTSFKNNPRVNGKEVDLYKLYTLVTSRGGWIQVNVKNEWAWLCEEFHLPSGCVNSGVGLKQIYLRYLDRYEKVHFLGEDGHQGDDDDEDSRHRKWNVRSLHSVPLTYNHHQHNVAETLREYNGLSSNLYKPSNYDKLALSLLSPLPNEQDFAINVCTFLSNEGKHTLRLDKYPRLVNHLLAHAGVFESTGTRNLFIECYSRVRNYSINSFWQDVLDGQDILDLTDERIFIAKSAGSGTTRGQRRRDRLKRDAVQNDAPCPMELDNGLLNCERLDNEIEIIEDRLVPPNDFDEFSSTFSTTFRDQNQNSIKFEEEDQDLFCVGRTLGTQDPYGQRVLQIAAILRNLSFTPENVAVLGKSRAFLRFVLLCVRARWSNLHQLGFDILGNIANEVILKEAGERLTSVMLQCVSKGIDSQDRFVIISCLEVLNKLSQQDLNEETLTLGLEDNVYELICRFLALSDIALLVYTLECLYALTSLGERPCTSVARVRGAIDTLVALVTVEAQSYGPKACILMRVVETVSSVPATQQQQQEPQQPSQTPVTSQATPQQQQQQQPQQQQTAGESSGAYATWMRVKSPMHQAGAPSPGAPTATNVPLTGISTPNSTTLSGTTTQMQQVQIQVQAQPQAQQVQAQPVQIQVQQQPQQQTVQQPKATTGGSSSRPATPKSAAAKAAANSLQQQHAHQQIIQENEQFALGWLRANFEPISGVKIEQEELYKKYLGCCTKIGRRGVIAPLHFPRCVRSVFGGTIGPNPVKGETSGTMYYEGIRVRANPGQITYPNQASAVTSQGTGAATSAVTTAGAKVQQRNDIHAQAPPPSSPILKAQLSAPPKPPTSSSSLNPVTGNLPIEPKSQVAVTHPHLSQALLASGAQQQTAPSSPGQQQQQVVQVIVKDDGRGGTTSSSIIKSLLATKVTVAGECMQAATPSVSTVTNATQIATSISANQLITASQVAQRQQQQQQQRQQQLQQQQVTSGVLPGTTPIKILANTKPKHTYVAVKKVQRLNGAKIIIANNCEKPDAMEVDSTPVSSPPSTQPSIATSSVQNHVSRSSTPSGNKQRNVCTPTVDDSDSTNNSLASSSGIGGSRDASGVGAEEENSLTSFEGLLNGAPNTLDIDAQDDGSSKDSSSLSSKDKPLQSMMLADLLERKVEGKEPILNGVLGKKDLVENHIKKVLKESPNDINIKADAEDALFEAPAKVGAIKRSASTGDEATDTKKAKYANGTSSPDSANVKSEELEDEKDEKVTVSSTAANLYAALAADIIDDEDEEPAMVKEETKPIIKDEVKVEAPVSQPIVAQEPQVQVQQQIQSQQQIAITQHQLQQQLQQLVTSAAGRQIVVAQQPMVTNNQIVINPQTKIATTTVAAAGRQNPQQQQVLQVQQGPGGQTHYVISGGVPGQNYVLAQPQTALVQGQAQTVLVAQQQGSNAKTIIILQPQAAQPQPQKVLAVTPQGQQVVVTQVPRPMLQSSAVSNIPPPLVPTSTVSQGTIVVSSGAAQPHIQTQQINATTTSTPVSVVTSTMASTPPTTRPATPQQPTNAAAIIKQTADSTTKETSEAQISSTTSMSTDAEDNNSGGGNSNNNNQSTNKQNETQATSTIGAGTTAAQTPTTSTAPSVTTASNQPKTITIKIDPNAFLCEWRGCLKQFKTPRKVFMHVCETHCPTGTEETICLWASCDSLKRRRFSLMTHLFDKHCCEEEMLKRRKQLALSGKTEVATTTVPTSTAHHPGYAPNAAFHAIKRHALEFVNPKELMQRPSKPAAAITSSSSPRPGQNPPPEQDDNEGPVTKSIRLTAALILRNLVIYSAHGRRHLRAYEPHLAGVALSNVESSRTIAQVLYDMNDQSSSGHR